MPEEIYMPKMSDHMENGEIVGWLVSEGDAVEEGQAVVEIATDKTTAEIEAPVSGIVRGIRDGLEKGTVVPVGETIAFIAKEDEEVPKLPPLGESDGERKEADAKKKESRGPAGRERETADDRSSMNDETSTRIKAAPTARRRARELHIDIQKVKGTGPDGYITENDVNTYAQSHLDGKVE